MRNFDPETEGRLEPCGQEVQTQKMHDCTFLHILRNSCSDCCREAGEKSHVLPMRKPVSFSYKV